MYNILKINQLGTLHWTLFSTLFFIKHTKNTVINLLKSLLQCIDKSAPLASLWNVTIAPYVFDRRPTTTVFG